MVIVLSPFISGMGAVDQNAVPEANPEPPLDVVQETSVTPTLSLADPFTMMVPAAVATNVVDGLLIVSDGGVVSVLAARV